ncbi:hypothetical protein SNEBB_009529 [Seison nebaliae]|nr:hypothetical protein SNEBB_009529 [Seison nebaliae]
MKLLKLFPSSLIIILLQFICYVLTQHSINEPSNHHHSHHPSLEDDFGETNNLNLPSPPVGHSQPNCHDNQNNGQILPNCQMKRRLLSIKDDNYEKDQLNEAKRKCCEKKRRSLEEINSKNFRRNKKKEEPSSEVPSSATKKRLTKEKSDNIPKKKKKTEKVEEVLSRVSKTTKSEHEKKENKKNVEESKKHTKKSVAVDKSDNQEKMKKNKTTSIMSGHEKKSIKHSETNEETKKLREKIGKMKVPSDSAKKIIPSAHEQEKSKKLKENFREERKRQLEDSGVDLSKVKKRNEKTNEKNENKVKEKNENKVKEEKRKMVEEPEKKEKEKEKLPKKVKTTDKKLKEEDSMKLSQNKNKKQKDEKDKKEKDENVDDHSNNDVNDDDNDNDENDGWFGKLTSFIKTSFLIEDEEELPIIHNKKRKLMEAKAVTSNDIGDSDEFDEEDVEYLDPEDDEDDEDGEVADDDDDDDEDDEEIDDDNEVDENEKNEDEDDENEQTNETEEVEEDEEEIDENENDDEDEEIDDDDDHEYGIDDDDDDDEDDADDEDDECTEEDCKLHEMQKKRPKQNEIQLETLENVDNDETSLFGNGDEDVDEDEEEDQEDIEKVQEDDEEEIDDEEDDEEIDEDEEEVDDGEEEVDDDEEEEVDDDDDDNNEVSEDDDNDDEDDDEDNKLEDDELEDEDDEDEDEDEDDEDEDEDDEEDEPEIKEASVLKKPGRKPLWLTDENLVGRVGGLMAAIQSTNMKRVSENEQYSVVGAKKKKKVISPGVPHSSYRKKGSSYESKNLHPPSPQQTEEEIDDLPVMKKIKKKPNRPKSQLKVEAKSKDTKSPKKVFKKKIDNNLNEKNNKILQSIMKGIKPSVGFPYRYRYSRWLAAHGLDKDSLKNNRNIQEKFRESKKNEIKPKKIKWNDDGKPKVGFEYRYRIGRYLSTLSPKQRQFVLSQMKKKMPIKMLKEEVNKHLKNKGMKIDDDDDDDDEDDDDDNDDRKSNDDDHDDDDDVKDNTKFDCLSGKPRVGFEYRYRINRKYGTDWKGKFDKEVADCIEKGFQLPWMTGEKKQKKHLKREVKTKVKKTGKKVLKKFDVKKLSEKQKKVGIEHRYRLSNKYGHLMTEEEKNKLRYPEPDTSDIPSSSSSKSSSSFVHWEHGEIRKLTKERLLELVNEDGVINYDKMTDKEKKVGFGSRYRIFSMIKYNVDRFNLPITIKRPDAHELYEKAKTKGQFTQTVIPAKPKKMKADEFGKPLVGFPYRYRISRWLEEGNNRQSAIGQKYLATFFKKQMKIESTKKKSERPTKVKMTTIKQTEQPSEQPKKMKKRIIKKITSTPSIEKTPVIKTITKSTTNPQTVTKIPVIDTPTNPTKKPVTSTSTSSPSTTTPTISVKGNIKKTQKSKNQVTKSPTTSTTEGITTTGKKTGKKPIKKTATNN